MTDFIKKWKLCFKVLPFLAVILILKFGVHYLDWEFLSLSPLFAGLITANIFLLGFLISGVLADYKESEKLPGELAASLEAICDECRIVKKSKQAKVAQECFDYILDLTRAVINWFHKKEKSKTLFNKITSLNHYFQGLEAHTQPNFITRMKQEQNNIRKVITRIHTIRETDFVQAGYLIAEIITFLLITGLIFVKIDPFREGVFFVTFVAFVVIYMVLLIKDLDNPFDYYESAYTDEISLKPLEDLAMRLQEEKLSYFTPMKASRLATEKPKAPAQPRRRYFRNPPKKESTEPKSSE